MNHKTELTDHIRDVLVAHFEEMHVQPYPYSKFEWKANPIPDENNLHHLYGWVPPKQIDSSSDETLKDHDIVIAPFCPEIIAEQTLHLDQDEFAAYMDCLRVQTALHVAHRAKPLAERERIIEEYMWQEGEDSLRLMNAVQMRALDKLLGAPDADD